MSVGGRAPRISMGRTLVEANADVGGSGCRAATVRAGRRLPEQVEVGAYYAVSEALANAAKHAHASAVHVELHAHDEGVRLAIRDDGIGGADPARGSGLTGLGDRIEALGGTLQVTSPAGHGTTLLIEIPCFSLAPAARVPAKSRRSSTGSCTTPAASHE